MTSFSDESADSTLWERLWVGVGGVPHTPLDETARQRSDLPRTLLPTPAGMTRPAVFDPALKQFGNAYQAGEPRFEDETAGPVWHRTRRTVLDIVLAAIAEGPWAEHLVLRGSVLMATWFGERARDPGDLDFVVVPQDWAMDEPRTAGVFDAIARDAAALAHARGDTVLIDAAGMVTEDIWTYDRVPGRRMLLPWTAPGIPGGTVQLDLVFNENLPAPAGLTELRPLGDGPGCRLLAASPGLSLAWKLLWLVSDVHPQGKDLYDAVLLAEHAPPEYTLVRDTFVLTGYEGLRPASREWLDSLSVDVGWEHFVADHPWAEQTPRSCAERLGRALEPFLAVAEPPGEETYTRWARWLRPLVESIRTVSPADPAAALARFSAGGMDGLAAAVVVMREIAGPETLGLEGALAAVLAHPDGWQGFRNYPKWCDQALGLLR
ncbi:nucleotidyl transferase AbiEii/AbiGii toxin family protein [Streptomyces sp. NBC_00872]|uniref:nucleotidyl transferase AbiEii/AbiGii toxin family protein n=1 Tax=Streptomyces sp. NBC_00872 TaxID=2903686 RepID=UPI003863CF36|nr:nucleotidyl transferase AbiEii/AbiGii toxin family protein [Streptomyces sp. NBC_00872]